VEPLRLSRKKSVSRLQEGIHMGQKLSTLAIVAGGLLMLLGLCFVPAALGQNKDEAILGAGICAFAFGALMAAGGLYLKAQVLNAANPGAALNPEPKQVRGGCDLCGTESPVIHCRVHGIHICGNCLGKHYDFRSCVYVPSTRRPAAAKASARAARA
jgi:hypothetical protein